MKESTAKEKILKNIRNGLIQTSAVPCNENIDLENQIFVQSEDEIDIGICNCEYLISRTGTIIVSSGIEDSVKILSLSEIAIVIATPSQIIPDIKISMQKLQDKYKNLPSVINYVSGPTLHYCFENKPSQGVGVKELYLILIDNMY